LNCERQASNNSTLPVVHLDSEIRLQNPLGTFQPPYLVGIDIENGRPIANLFLKTLEGIGLVWQ
jgi:hypothetical protein